MNTLIYTSPEAFALFLLVVIVVLTAVLFGLEALAKRLGLIK